MKQIIKAKEREEVIQDLDTEISKLEHVENDLKAKIKENEVLNIKVEKMNDKISELNKSLEKEKSENKSILSEKSKEIDDLKSEIKNRIYIIKFYYYMYSEK